MRSFELQTIQEIAVAEEILQNWAREEKVYWGWAMGVNCYYLELIAPKIQQELTQLQTKSILNE
jgi:hypothetical protein